MKILMLKPLDESGGARRLLGMILKKMPEKDIGIYEQRRH